MLNLPRRFRFIIHKQKRQNQSDGRQLRSGWRRAFHRWRVVYVNVKSHASGGRKEQLSLKREKWAESHSGVAAALFKGPLIKWQSLCCLHMEAPSSIQRLSVLPRIRQRLEPEREREKLRQPPKNLGQSEVRVVLDVGGGELSLFFFFLGSIFQNK